MLSSSAALITLLIILHELDLLLLSMSIRVVLLRNLSLVLLDEQHLLVSLTR